jgi:hypothetical protein
MNCLNCLTALAVACLGMIATSSQQVRAQDFTLFEHAIVPPKTGQQPAREYLPAIYQAEPENVSYREGLYMAAIAEAERRYPMRRNAALSVFSLMGRLELRADGKTYPSRPSISARSVR